MIKDVKLTAEINGIDYSFMAYKIEPTETAPYGETVVNVYNNHNSDSNYTVGYPYEESELSCISHEFYKISRKHKVPMKQTTHYKLPRVHLQANDIKKGDVLCLLKDMQYGRVMFNKNSKFFVESVNHYYNTSEAYVRVRIIEDFSGVRIIDDFSDELHDCSMDLIINQVREKYFTILPKEV